jgi:hypothetical protein
VEIYPLDNDTSFPGTVLSVVSIQNNAQNGECIVMNGQVVVYIPKPNFHGVDHCTYTACVGSGLCDSAVITITVEGAPCDDKPTRNIDLTTPPTLRPTTNGPTTKPVPMPTQKPTQKPVTNSPTLRPTNDPTKKPTPKPTQTPTRKPVTNSPTTRPTDGPTKKPTPKPSQTPTALPTPKPTQKPTSPPTPKPTAAPIRCEERQFHYTNGCCTNADVIGSTTLYGACFFFLNIVFTSRSAANTFSRILC